MLLLEHLKVLAIGLLILGTATVLTIVGVLITRIMVTSPAVSYAVGITVIIFLAYILGLLAMKNWPSEF